jgi:hypothetical protein
MAKIEVEVEIDDEVDCGAGPRPGVEACCTRCGHITRSYGTTDRSVRRCLALMGEECPEDEGNFYVSVDEL